MAVKIYICTHTDFECPVKNKVYEVLDVRKFYPDDKAPNGIDAMFYSELLSYKYIADNWELPEYVGFCQYRKYYGFMDKVPRIPSLIKKHGCIAADIYTVRNSVYRQYAKCFNFADLDIVKGIVASLYPELWPTFRSMLEGDKLYVGNMFIMRREDFLDVMEIVWNVIERFLDAVGTDILGRIESHPKLYLDKKGILSEVQHQYRMGGNIGERVVSAYIMHRFPEVKTYPIVYTESRRQYKELKQ